MPIERIAPELDRIVSPGEDIQELGSGFGGPAGPAEGPLWWREGGYLLFSDIHNDRRMKWAPGEGVSVFYEPTSNANGLTRDPQGRLIACEHGSRRVSRMEPDGTITVVANNYQARRLNRPNDVVVKSDGSIYFTDPGAPDPGLDLDFAGVYRVSPDLGTMTLLVRDFIVPNGLAFSPDERILYINDSRRRHIRAFELMPTGTLALWTDRVFCDLKGERPWGTCARRHEGRRGTERVLHRAGRHLDHGPLRQAPGHHPDRGGPDHQRRLPGPAPGVAERVIRPAKAKTRRLRVLVVTIC